MTPWSFSGQRAIWPSKKIFPSLYQLVRRGRLNVPIIGVARAGYDEAKLRERARESVTAAKGAVDPAVLKKFLSLIRRTSVTT